MKVLIVNRYMGLYGGAEQVVKELSLGLTKRGVENLVVALNISKEVREKTKGVEIVTPKKDFPYLARSISFVSSLGIFREIYALQSLVRKYQKDFDIINIHNFPANWVVNGIKKPVVWMCNEIPDFYNNYNLSFPLRCMRKLGILLDRGYVAGSVSRVCVADELNKKAVKERYKRDACVIPYGIDVMPFNEGASSCNEYVCNTFGLQRDDFLLLQVGVISPTKNQKESVDALIKIGNKIPKCKLILAGNDTTPYAQDLKHFVRKNGVQDRVIFTGILSKEEVCKLYSACKACVFPVKLQGGYLSVFEAISFDKPVVVSPRMGASCLVKSHDLGIVSSELGSSIQKAYDNYDFYSKKAQQAGEWVRSNLTWDRFTESFLDLFKEILQT